MDRLKVYKESLQLCRVGHEHLIEGICNFFSDVSKFNHHTLSSSKNIDVLLRVIHGRKALCQCRLQPSVSGPRSFSKASVGNLGHNFVSHRCGFKVPYLLVSILRCPSSSSSIRLPDQITPGSLLLTGQSVALLFPLLTMTRKYRLVLLISRCIK